MPIIAGAEPFFFPGGRRGALLVHGFTGAPSEMRPLGEFLHKQGFTVWGPRLCGHGTTVEEMAGTKWPQWYSAVEDGYHLLKAVCDEVYVAGLSMGGLLAFNLAAEYPVAAIAALSTPIYIADRRLPLLPVYSLFRSYVPKRRRKMDAGDVYNISYDRTPLTSLTSLVKLIRRVDALLPRINTPALIVQSLREHTVRPESASYIADKLASREKRLVWLEKSGHVVTLDIEREQVFQAVGDFFRERGT